MKHFNHFLSQDVIPLISAKQVRCLAFSPIVLLCSLCSRRHQRLRVPPHSVDRYSHRYLFLVRVQSSLYIPCPEKGRLWSLVTYALAVKVKKVMQYQYSTLNLTLKPENDIMCTDLVSLWEQRLTDNNKKGDNEDESVEANSSCADTLPVTIYTSLSETSDGSLASNDAAASHTPSPIPRRAMLLEMVIHSKIEIIEKMKDVIGQMMATDTDADADREETKKLVSSEKFSELIEALMSRINKEETGCCSSLTSSSSRSEDEEGCLLTKTNSLKSTVESTGAENNGNDNIYLRMEKRKLAYLQATVQDLESTISLQGAENTILKTELARLEQMLDDLQTSASSTEDEIESLKAEIVTLHIKSDVQKEETLVTQMNLAQEVEGLQRTIHKMKSHASCDKHMVKTLKADIMKVKLSSSMKEEDMHDELEEMRVQLDLHDLEGFSFSG